MTARALRPVLPPPPSPQLPPVQHHRLRNGLEVLLIERHDLPVVEARVIIRGGARHDDGPRAGRAFLTTDLLDQGTARRSATTIADEAERLGASVQTRASWDACALALHVLTPRLEHALDLLADVTTAPAFPEPEFARKRTERLTAILQDHDDPRAVASIAFSAAVYGPVHPFGSPSGGTRASVENLTSAQLRDFYVTRFSPGNAFLVLVGDVHASSLLPLLETLFSDWTPRPVPPDETFHPPPAPPTAIHLVHQAAAPQSELRVGRPGPPRRTPDYFPLLVANTILGGSFTSRLNMRLREEKAYTYGAGSHFAFRAAGGPFVAATAVFAGATADAVADMVREIARMSEERAGAVELERAKNYIVLGLPRTFETTSDIAEHVSELALHELGDDYYDHYAERVRAVSSEEVRAAAERWLRAESLTVVVAGDADAVRSDLEALGLGAVHVREDG